MGSKLYFGHPINTYNTELEKQLLIKIQDVFPDLPIENPNQLHHQEGYQLWKKLYGNGMRYYFEVVLPHCTGGIFLPFRDGKWGAGVFGEAEFLFKQGCVIFEITHTFELKKIEDIKNVPLLSVEETRLRVYSDGGMRPF